MNEILNYDSAILSHMNNITQKKKISLDESHQQLCADIERKYNEYLSKIDFKKVLEGDFLEAVCAVEEYLEYAKMIEKRHSKFNWRSDYAGSILPEFLYRLLATLCRSLSIPAIFSTRNSMVELSLSGALKGGWKMRRKNQDLSIGLRREKILKDGVEQVFVVPLVAMEVKTNIDINKLNGLDFSAERLKMTFPSARYFLVTETVDFSLQCNYASGSIDEIYALRKQVRSAARKQKELLKPDVFEAICADVIKLLQAGVATVGHVYDRLPNGKLINGA